jgi:ABC-2 type transport system permease protein
MNVIVKTIRLQMLNSWVRPMFRFCLIANPIMNTFFLYEMFLNSKETNFLAYVVFGSGLMALWGCICFSSVGDINRERYMGTLPLIYASPTSFGLIIIGKIIGNTILSMSGIVVSLITVKLITRDHIRIGSPGYLILSLLLAMISFSAVALCIAYLLMISRKTTLYMNLLEIPVIMLCGFVFPIEVLPQWAQVIAKAIPITWVIKLIRMSIAGVTNGSEYRTTFLVSLIMIGICILLTWKLYRTIDRQIRVKATLEVS